jgi:diguanylate cyclase (GGDEF)-like protein/PAS domain S-box-containing protein
MISGRPSDSSARRAFAAQWAAALSATAYLSKTEAEVEQFLSGLLDGIVDELLAGGTGGVAASNAGAALVTWHATGPNSLRHSVQVLGTGLPALLEDAGFRAVPATVVAVLGPFSAGYAEALRRTTFEQQEAVKQALERVLRMAEAQSREVFTASAAGIAISELDGSVVRANRALAHILGRTDAELTGLNLHDLFHQDGHDQLRAAYRDVVTGREPRLQLQRPVRREDGDTAWVLLSVAALRDEHGTATQHVTIVEDITDLRLLQDRLNNQALHDVLTGLPNRQYFALKVETALGQLEPTSTITLFQLDIDSFSLINDGFGFHVGDRLLQIVAQRLQAVFARECAQVARIASDEFAVLVENSPTTPNAAMLAAQINDELSEPVYLDGMGLALTVSIGVVSRQAGGITPAELLRQSDATLRRAKSNGKRQWALFDQPLDARDRQRFTLAAGMPGALENGEFVLTYQPMARLDDRRFVAVEALTCWEHPKRGRQDHDEVTKLARYTGVVLPLGAWTLRTACADAAKWLQEFGEGTPLLSINVPTALANDPDLVQIVHAALESACLPASRLQLGVPVKALLFEEGDAEDNLQVLAEMGVRTSIHGFGRGRSGLVLIENLPVHSVRIAGWPVRQLAEPPGSITARALTEFVSLVHTFGATVIVTGLQTDGCAAWWHQAGADIACGGWFAVPCPADGITEMLRG